MAPSCSMRTLGGLLAAASAARAAFPTPTWWQQCDPAWGAFAMGTKGSGEDSTICGEGCAMSSLANALAAYGATVPLYGVSLPANPMTLNAWLEVNQGYTCAAGDCNNLVLDAVTRMNASWTLVGELDPPPSVAEIAAGLAGGHTVYLAHVNNRSHFVLLNAYNGNNTFNVSDPNWLEHHVTTYDYAGIADVIVYNVSFFGPPPASAPVVPHAYPLYKQCDPAWAATEIGSAPGITICDVGCLMSSVSMALAYNGIVVPSGWPGSTPGQNTTANPQTLNGWLQAHGGYDDNDDLDEDAIPGLDPAHIGWSDTYGMHRTNDIPLPTIQALVTAGQPVIANVDAGRHFVLVIGWDAADPDTLLVNDPGFERASYSYSQQVVGWRLFNMTRVGSGVKVAAA